LHHKGKVYSAPRIPLPGIDPGSTTIFFLKSQIPVEMNMLNIQKVLDTMIIMNSKLMSIEKKLDENAKQLESIKGKIHALEVEQRKCNLFISGDDF